MTTEDGGSVSNRKRWGKVTKDQKVVSNNVLEAVEQGGEKIGGLCTMPVLAQ
jgi:hypothetical protein